MAPGEDAAIYHVGHLFRGIQEREPKCIPVGAVGTGTEDETLKKVRKKALVQGTGDLTKKEYDKRIRGPRRLGEAKFFIM